MSRPTRKRCPGACRSGYTPDAPPARAHLPCTSLRIVLVSSPQVCAGPGGAAGRRRARSAGRRAVGAGTWGPQPGQEGEDEAAFAARPCGLGAASSAERPPPAPHPPCPLRAASRSPLPLRPVRRPPTARPGHGGLVLPHGGRPMGGARSPSANGRALGPGGAGGPGRGGAGRVAGLLPSLPRGPEVCAPCGICRGHGGSFCPPPEVGIPKNGRPREAPDGQGLKGEGQSAAGLAGTPSPPSPSLLLGPPAPSSTSCLPDLRSSAPLHF